MYSARVTVSCVLILASSACGRASSSGAALPSFSDLSTAPMPIQRAARAVVRTHTADQFATGSFLSATGLLMTNNHVLGTTVCPTEGCSLELTFLYQRGEAYEPPRTLFAVPVAVDVGLDMVVAQVYESKGGAMLSTPDYLTLVPEDASSLINTHVTVVGHPDGALKKWSAGQAYLSNGDWIYTTAYVLPGNSGSPLLNDEGQMVGILHRGTTDEGLYAPDGVDIYSIGTPSGLLSAAMSAPLPASMVTTTAVTTDAAVVAFDLVYLNGGASMYESSSSKTSSVLSALGTACDSALATTAYASPEALTAALQPCVDAMSWIECRTDAPSVGFATECPSASDATKWAARFQSANRAFVALNGQPDLILVSYGIAILAPDMAAGQTNAASSLVAALDAASHPLDPYAAEYLANYGVTSYQGTELLSYVQGYPSIPGYDRNAADIADAALGLLDQGAMTSDEAMELFTALATDGTVDVDDKLYIEKLQYNLGEIH